MPNLVVEVAFDGPGAASPTWVDVSAYVLAEQRVQVKRGRSDERANGNEPGMLSLALKNTDGRFTPGRTASPYYPSVIPWRRIRTRLVSGANTHYQFYGYIWSWRQSWMGGAVPVVQVTAYDSMALLRRRKLRSVLAESVLADSPVGYWPLGEPQGATRAVDLMGGTSLVVTAKPGTLGTLEFGAGTGPGADGASAVTFDATAGMSPYLSARLPAVDGQVPTIEAWVATGATFWDIAVLTDDADNLALVSITPGGYVQASTYVAGLIQSVATSTTKVTDGRTHHIVASFDGATNIYIDGVLADSQVGSLGMGTGVRIAALRPYTGVGGSKTGTVSHLAVFDVGWSSGMAAAHYAAGLGFIGDTAYDRLTRWCAWVGVPLSLSGTDEGIELGHIPTEGRTALECVQDVLSTDYGSTFLADRAAPGVVFTARTARYGAASTVSITKPGMDFEPIIDPTYNASRVTVAAGTGTFTVEDAAVEATYGELELSVQAWPQSDDYAEALGEWLIRLANSPDPRYPIVSTVLTAMAKDSALWSGAAIPVLGALATVSNLPSTAPTTSVLAFIEGIEETVSGGEWSMTCSLSPVAPWTNVWTIQGAGNSGKVESGYVVAL